MKRRYKASLGATNKEKRSLGTDLGLCFLVAQRLHKTLKTQLLLVHLLKSQAPGYGGNTENLYWWTPGAIKRRLQCIEATIKLLKETKK